MEEDSKRMAKGRSGIDGRVEIPLEMSRKVSRIVGSRVFDSGIAG